MRIGIDLGGTKTEIIVLDDAGNIGLRERIPTPGNDYEATVGAMVELVNRTAESAGLAADVPVGIGIPGAESLDTGLVKNSNSTCLIGQPLRADMAARLGRPVRLANDANCFALSEATDGAGAGAGSVFGVILGTGVGGGFVIDGKLLTGANAIAGEWGHNPMPYEREGRVCYCGRRDCNETYLSGPALAGEHRRQAGQIGLNYTAEQIVRAAATGDLVSEALLKRYEVRLARGLASVINVFDPEVIVLGGGLSNIARLYENVPRYWAEFIFSDTVHTRLVPHRHGDSSGVRGAAWLWPAQAARR